MTTPAPWKSPEWRVENETALVEALREAGRPPSGPIELVRAWGRSCVRRVPTAGGRLWIKQAYRLPPGEELVVERLAERWSDRLPTLVAVLDDGFVMEELPGRELSPEDPLEHWLATARGIAELEAGETDRVPQWLELGVRDRRAPCWRPAVEALVESPVLRPLSAELRRRLELLLPDFIARYEEAFTGEATLVHQDSGCCNVHVSEQGPILFDWTDVVIGHAAFSCDRLLDQVPPERKEAVIAAFLEASRFDRAEFDAMRRSNILHEVLRYHDELAWLAADDDVHVSLGNSVRSQLEVLVEHEWPRR